MASLNIENTRIPNPHTLDGKGTLEISLLYRKNIVIRENIQHKLVLFENILLVKNDIVAIAMALQYSSGAN